MSKQCTAVFGACDLFLIIFLCFWCCLLLFWSCLHIICCCLLIFCLSRDAGPQLEASMGVLATALTAASDLLWSRWERADTPGTREQTHQVYTYVRAYVYLYVICVYKYGINIYQTPDTAGQKLNFGSLHHSACWTQRKSDPQIIFPSHYLCCLLQ